MKWYQPIECNNVVKKPLICNYSNFEDYGYDENDFKKGKEIYGWNEEIIMKADLKKYDGTPDDALQNAYMIPIYSIKLKNELVKANIKGIQYLPIKVYNYNEKEKIIFYVANFLNYVEALDYKKSIYNRFSYDFPNPSVRGEIAGVLKFVLKKEKLEGFDIIRLKDYDQRFFVSEKFKDLFEVNHFTGYSFKEVEIY